MAQTVAFSSLPVLEPVNPDYFSKNSLSAFELVGKKISKIPFNKENALNITKARFINCGLENLPPGLEEYSLIDSIDLTENLISRLSSNTFLRFECLHRLSLVANKLTNFKMQFPNSLRFLDLSYNKNLNIAHVWALKIPQLEEIRISHCGIKKLPQNPPSWSASVSVISLEGNFLEEIPEYFGNFENLTKLLLYGNRLKRVDFNSLPQQFNELSFYYNYIEDWNPPPGKNLSVKILELNNNFFREFPLKVLEVQKLSILKLQYCEISGKLDFPIPQTINALDLSHNSITELGESFISSLSRLSALKLSFNKISKIADAFPETSSLSDIDINFNEIEEFPPSFSNLIHLDRFYANHNKLKSFVQLRCKHLTSLDISFNQLKELPDTFSDCSILAVLDVSFNQLATLPPSLGTCRKLNDLYASGNQLTVFPRCFFSFSQLKTLVLSKNKLSTIPLSLSSFFFLQTLDLSVNHFTDVPKFISEFPSLRVFSMAHNLIEKIPDNFYFPKVIAYIDFSYNKLTSFDVAQEMPNLHSLNLDCNFIKSIDTKLFPNLKFLSLNSNPLQPPFPPLIVELALMRNLKSYEMLGCGKLENEVPPLPYHFLSDSHVSIDEEQFGVGYSSTMGVRPSMEDAVAFHSYGNHQYLFALFDGHQGNVAATNAAVWLHNEIQKFLKSSSDDFSKEFANSFATVNQILRKMIVKDGCTSVAAFFKENKCYCAGVGDSRILRVKKTSQERLTTDKKPMMRDEFERLTNKSVRISYDGRIERKLAVSRVLGDFWCSVDPKNPDPLFELPEIKQFEIDDDDIAIILACDGLWDVVTDEVAADIVRSSKSPQDAANVLRVIAFSLGSKDNISVIVVYLHPKDEQKGFVYNNEIEVMPPVVEEVEEDDNLDFTQFTGMSQRRRRR